MENNCDEIAVLIETRFTSREENSLNLVIYLVIIVREKKKEKKESVLRESRPDVLEK